MLNTVREAQKGKKSKTCSGPCKGLQQEQKECSVLYKCSGFNSVCFVGVIVLKTPEMVCCNLKSET